ncbi:hypothetical protein [Microbispora bryophytorum]|uniref:hypothetical protein n=1 Tax=Microbispora bryophytorum TaxID=1460882 RepID=UPI0033EFAF83
MDYADGRLLVRTAKEQAATASGWGLSLGNLVESPSNWARSLLLGRGSADVTIDLPAGASANADGVHTQWGRVTSKVPGRQRLGTPHVRITGELPYGSVTIRPARR